MTSLQAWKFFDCFLIGKSKSHLVLFVFLFQLWAWTTVYSLQQTNSLPLAKTIYDCSINNKQKDHETPYSLTQIPWKYNRIWRPIRLFSLFPKHHISSYGQISTSLLWGSTVQACFGFQYFISLLPPGAFKVVNWLLINN